MKPALDINQACLAGMCHKVSRTCEVQIVCCSHHFPLVSVPIGHGKLRKYFFSSHINSNQRGISASDKKFPCRAGQWALITGSRLLFLHDVHLPCWKIRVSRPKKCAEESKDAICAMTNFTSLKFREFMK